ncbi:hypothetical protein HY385_00415 [Candidatus Daviesbacteria bacterium]|nr:hypothetical protein [Candidatus Daviesbacteria bacterium]
MSVETNEVKIGKKSEFNWLDPPLATVCYLVIVAAAIACNIGSVAGWAINRAVILPTNSLAHTTGSAAKRAAQYPIRFCRNYL